VRIVSVLLKLECAASKPYWSHGEPATAGDVLAMTMERTATTIGKNELFIVSFLAT
jgi:hypothetical protein